MSSTSPKYTIKQDDFVKSSQQQSNEIVGTSGRTPRDRDRCLFCCTPKVLMIISVIYFILGVIHTISQLTFIYGCRDLYNNLDSTIPYNLSYDPSTTPTLNVNTWNYLSYFNDHSNLFISQTNDASATNTTIQIRTATKDSNNKFDTSLTSSSYNINLVGDGIGSLLAFWKVKCTVSKVDVILPQQMNPTTTSSPININSNGLDVKFQQNSVPYLYSINVKTTSADIDMENISVTSASFQSTSGDVKGSISSLHDEFSIESTSGDINVKASANTANGSPKIGLKSTSGDIGLELDVPNVVVRPVIDISATSGDINTDITFASGITDSQITIEATSGDIDLNLHNSFQGKYQITTTSGDVDVGIGNDKNHDRQGKVGPDGSQGSLNIRATSGDVNVKF